MLRAAHGRIMPQPPDIVLLGAEWQTRALIRTQLIEDGFEVVATDTWPAMRPHFRPGSKPRLAIVDLKGLPNPVAVLKDLRVLMAPDRVLVVTAIGTVEAVEIEQLGFRQVARPIIMRALVDTAAQIIRGVTSRPLPLPPARP